MRLKVGDPCPTCVSQHRTGVIIRRDYTDYTIPISMPGRRVQYIRLVYSPAMVCSNYHRLDSIKKEKPAMILSREINKSESWYFRKFYRVLREHGYNGVKIPFGAIENIALDPENITKKIMDAVIARNTYRAFGEIYRKLKVERDPNLSYY